MTVVCTVVVFGMHINSKVQFNITLSLGQDVSKPSKSGPEGGKGSGAGEAT